MYGLILFARTLGRDSRLVQTRFSSPRTLHLKAWAVRVGNDTLHLLLLNKGPRPARFSLQLPASGVATVERLLAPSARSRTRVTFAGQRLGDDARFRGRRVVQVIRPGARGYSVTVRGISAALLTFHVRPGSLQALR